MAAVTRQAQQLIHVSNLLLSAPQAQLAQRLMEISGMEKVFYAVCGATANETALKIAKTATGRHEVLAFQGAYHGMGQGPLSLMGAVGPKQSLGPLLPGVHFLPYASCTRCPLKLAPGTCGHACAHLLGSTLADDHSGVTRPAAIIVAGSTGRIGIGTVLLTLSFAVGVAIPLLGFALAGRGLIERIRAFRSRERGLRIAAGVAMIALAVGLAFNLPQMLQRLLPDYTAELQQSLADQQGDAQFVIDSITRESLFDLRRKFARRLEDKRARHARPRTALFEAR